jgi:hypothetical protein
MRYNHMQYIQHSAIDAILTAGGAIPGGRLLPPAPLALGPLLLPPVKGSQKPPEWGSRHEMGCDCMADKGCGHMAETRDMSTQQTWDAITWYADRVKQACNAGGPG